MKFKNSTRILLIVGILLVVSCQQDETTTQTGQQSTEDIFARNWLEADLSAIFTGEEMNYPIANQQLKKILNHKEVYQVRFVPGILDNQLHVKVVSVDAAGAVLAEELVTQDINVMIGKQLETLKNTVFDKASVAKPVVAKHILQFDKAATYLNSWKQKSTHNINEITSYDGMRIRHFSIEPQVIQYMIDLGSEFINLS
ncbi:hypothetical protein [Aquimarina sp. RZ0]|uniref:hypothetical protein n=1 Tax=Aquimarina sp. RZ0 TaxID=2607730 RepID=UPI0011F0AC9A|nr:hypothetical protein [Aquimarina sp. RZ0]KAA1246908.1 hypothetical protein F0000_05465 [Aquimarina sp. RZ0]